MESQVRASHWRGGKVACAVGGRSARRRGDTNRGSFMARALRVGRTETFHGRSAGARNRSGLGGRGVGETESTYASRLREPDRTRRNSLERPSRSGEPEVPSSNLGAPTDNRTLGLIERFGTSGDQSDVARKILDAPGTP